MAAARRSVDGRLSGAQAELALQEESVRRSERERRAMLDQVASLERSLQATESELRASQVRTGAEGQRAGDVCWSGRVSVLLFHRGDNLLRFYKNMFSFCHLGS